MNPATKGFVEARSTAIVDDGWENFFALPEAEGRAHPTSPFPALEEEALTTRRCASMDLAVAVGLDADVLADCAEAMGEDVQLIATQDGAAAGDLLSVLRPRMVVASSHLDDVDGARVAAAAAACGARVVCLARGDALDAIARLVRRSAPAAFGDGPVTSVRASRAHFSAQDGGRS